MKKIKINKGYGRNRYQNKPVEKNKRKNGMEKNTEKICIKKTNKK